MLFQEYNAKLSDFGLAKDGPEGDKTHVSTRVMGTYGYAAPEYVMTGKCDLMHILTIIIIIMSIIIFVVIITIVIVIYQPFS